MKLQTLYSQFKSECSCMLIYSILILLLSYAVTLRRDKFILFTRVVIIVLLSFSILAAFSLYINNFSNGLFRGLFHITSISQILYIFVLIICAIILQLIAFYPIRVWLEEYSYLNNLFLDIYMAINITKVIFKPFKITKYLVYLIFAGIVSDFFILLPFHIQMSIFIILLGILVEIYDNNKLKIKFFINGIINKKTYYITVFILRFLGFYSIINFLVFILPLDIFIINFYILPYLEISYAKKLLFFSFLGEVFSGIWIPFNLITPTKCDSWNAWDAFVRANPTVIMPPKYNSLAILAPEIDRNETLLWYRKGSKWHKYFWASHHPNNLKVYGLRNSSSPFTWVNAYPLPECRGFYIRTTHNVFVPLNTTNSQHNMKHLYVRNSQSEYILTPFKVQQGIKKIKN